MFAKIAPTLLHRLHDRGEVVVGEHHVGRLLGDIGAGDAHRDADVGRLERRRVVHAVAGHRHHPPSRCSACTIRSLCFWIDARVHRHLSDRRRELSIRRSGELGAGRRRGHRLRSRDRLQSPRRSGMIAGDHHRADARRLGACHRLFGLIARRIDHADHAREDEFVLDWLVDCVPSLASSGRHGRKATPSVRSASPARSHSSAGSRPRRAARQRPRLAHRTSS